MLDKATHSLVQFFKKLGTIHAAEQFFYLLQRCIQQIDSAEDYLDIRLEQDELLLYTSDTELLRIAQRLDAAIHFDLIREADGRLFSYAGAAATPQGYHRLSINIKQSELSNALIQEWLAACTSIIQTQHPLQPSTIASYCFRAATNLNHKKQFFSYLRQNSAYQDLVEELLPNILQQKSFQRILNAQEFIFQKAIQSFKNFIETPISKELAKAFLTAYENFEGSYDQFAYTLPKKHPIYTLAHQIGTLISYLDGKAAGKKLWNQYEDQRTIALAVVRQNHWVAQLIRYHQNKDLSELSPNVQNAIRYLLHPLEHTATLSEKHRRMITEELIQRNYQAATFDQDILAFFDEFDLPNKTSPNYNYLISSILYHPNIAELWKKKEEYPLGTSYYPEQIYEAEIPYQLFPSREEMPLNQILYGPAGTGKTYQAIRIAISILEGLPLDDLLQETADMIHHKLEHYSTEGQVALVSFHPSMSYEDFIEGIKPLSSDHGLSYVLEDGIFKQMADRASQNPSQPYVLIIDEINRGQVASIFGELISLIEEDKRQNAPNALSTLLPYSKQRFSIPANLYIIGTMNTADRGIEALDIALRRRFYFKAVPPQPLLLNKDMMGVNLALVLETINARIQQLLGDQQAIGHAYFLGIQNLDQLNQCFEYKIIPLLEEYFYHDLSKLGLVLGKNFVSVVQQQQSLADFPIQDYQNHIRPIFKIKPFPHPVASYISIYDIKNG